MQRGRVCLVREKMFDKFEGKKPLLGLVLFFFFEAQRTKQGFQRKNAHHIYMVPGVLSFFWKGHLYILTLTTQKNKKGMGEIREKEKQAMGKNIVGFKLTNICLLYKFEASETRPKLMMCVEGGSIQKKRKSPKT